MKAIRLHSRGGPESLRFEDAPTPRPGAGEVLVRVRAAAVTPTELLWVPTAAREVTAAPRPCSRMPIPAGDLPFVRRTEAIAAHPRRHPLGGVAVEVGGGGEHAREQERRIDRGQFALPDPPARLDV
jgi:hypothetical protein